MAAVILHARALEKVEGCIYIYRERDTYKYKYLYIYVYRERCICIDIDIYREREREVMDDCVQLIGKASKPLPPKFHY